MLLYIPKVRLRCRQGPKWFDSNIRHRFNCLRTLRRKYNSHPTLHTLLKIKSLEEHLQTEVSSAKSAFESNLLKSLQPNDCTKGYSYIHSVTGQNTIPRCLHFNSTSAEGLEHERSQVKTAFQCTHTMGGPEPSLHRESTDSLITGK